MGRFRVVIDARTGSTVTTPFTLEEEAAADAVVIPTPFEIDQAELNRILASSGSVVRALALLTFQEINALRVLANLPAYTMEQFTTSLINRMR